MKKYDYVVLGGGFGGLAFALLAARAGNKVALFEAHHTLGGYGHTFSLGPYQFCSSMHYFYNTQEQGAVNRFLKEVNLEEKIQFTSLNPNGFDRIVVDDYSFEIPNGLDNYHQKLLQHFPDQTKGINALFSLIYELNSIESYSKKNLLKLLCHSPYKTLSLLKKTSQSSYKALQQLNIDGLLRAILLARLGNLGSFSTETPLIFLLLECILYTTSATFPTKGVGHIVATFREELLKYSADIFTSNEIKKINITNKQVDSIIDQNGHVIKADLYISNIDPQATLRLCNYRSKKYDYTYSCFSLFLGLKDFNLSESPFGNFNTWYLPSADVDKDCKKVLEELNYQHSFHFISTPSAHVEPGILAPHGCHTMQIIIPANYQKIESLYRQNHHEYELFKQRIYENILETLSNKFYRDIRSRIDVSELWSPMDLANKVKTPCGALYGMRLNKLTAPFNYSSPFKNLYFVGATPSRPGLSAALTGSKNLYSQLEK